MASLSGGKPWTTDAAVRSTQVWLPPGMVNFGIGQPDFDLLPLDLLRIAAEHRLSQGNPYLLNYGSEQGDGYLRQALVGFLDPHYGESVDAESVVVTAGASQGMDMICTLFANQGDTILVEEPSYFLALRIFEDHGLHVVSLPTDADGLVVEALEEAIGRHAPAFLYVIPTFQNPTGVTMSLPRRRRLAEVASAHNFLVVADEVYHLLHYGPAPPPPLVSYAHTAPILSLGSFSKILAPGLRLGWIQGTSSLVERIVQCGLLDSGGCPSHFASGLVRSILELDMLTSYLDMLKETYATRCRTLSAGLRATIPEASFHEADGGFFLWITLPEWIDTDDLLPLAEERQVSYVPGSRFSSQDGMRSSLRLSFAFHDADALSLGVDRLCGALNVYFAP